MKIHSLYQDLYLTDMKKDLNEAEYELRSQKEMYSGAIKGVSSMKKEMLA